MFCRASQHLLAIIEPSQPVWSYGATRHTPSPEDNINAHAETDQDKDEDDEYDDVDGEDGEEGTEAKGRRKEDGVDR